MKKSQSSTNNNNNHNNSSLDYSSSDLRHHLNRINRGINTRSVSGQNLSPRQTTGRRPQQSSTSRQTTSNGVPRAEPLKFEGEFDFEQANARFEQEIEKEFTDKLKISSDKQRSGSKRNQSKDKQQQQQQHDLDSSLTNSQSMTLQDMQDQQHMLMKQKSLSTTNTDHDLSKDHHHTRDTHTMSAEEKNFYDKNISFFDRISCEANDKLQSKERKNWKEERKMNAETFGLIQRQQNDMMKSNYTRTYNNSNRYNNNNNQNQNGSSSGRNYPRNYNSNGQQQQQHQQYRNSNSGNQMRQSQSQQQQRMTVGGGQRSTNYSRRNDMDDYNSMSQRGGQRRFGSR